MWQSDKVLGSPSPDAVTALPKAPALSRYDRSRLTWEVWLVLAVTVGRSALYSVISLVRSSIQALQQGGNLADQGTSLNPSQDAAAFWDILYQLLDVFFALAL